MSQIVERKKKGRPSKADLALRAAAAKENDIRRTLRRRNVRYNVDFGDEDDKDELRREKKLKLLLKKLQSTEGGDGESSTSRTRHVAHAPFASASSSSDGDRPSKKRKIDGDDDGDGEIDGDDEYEEVRRRKDEPKVADSVPGTQSDPPAGLPLPEKKSLELILDKLQKKDTYGVYAEPVDPEELPDYHDVIEHPMDFATVRKKLENGSYSALEQFESDVYLICTNAMQYNAPDTIYYKQAHSIQELAKKKFQGLRSDDEHYDKEKELKLEQKPTSNSSAKKQIKKPMSQTTEEPVGSDFFSGATLATAAGDFNATHDCGLERLTYVDGPVVGNTSLFENNFDKAEDLQGRVPLSRFGRKAFLHDGNRRATYIISHQPMVRSKSIFTTFDSEIKQLVAVGIHEDHSYARSLARFAATLGPVAWKVASTRIEDALPTGFKFGRGWVGYYEPLPTPILMLENCSLKEPVFLTKSYGNSDARKDDKTSKSSLPVQDHPISFFNLEGKPSLFGAAVTEATVSPTESAVVSAREQSVRGANLEGKQPFLCSGGSISTTSASANYQQLSPRSRRNDQGKKFVKQVELNSPISANQNTSSFVAETQISNGLDVPASQAMENVSRNRNLLPSVAFKQPENHGFVAGGLTNGKLSSNSLNRSETVALSSDSFPKQIVRAGTYFPHGPEQVLSDPVQLRRMLAENADKQQKSLNHSPVYNPSVMPQVPSSRMDDSNNASAAAARTWMSIGEGVSKTAAGSTSTNKNQISADSLNNPNRDLQRQVPQFRGDFPVSGMHFHPAKNSLPLQAFVTPPVQMGNEAQIQNRPMNFPPSIADLPRFQMQSPWQGVNPQRQSRQKQESLPPDLNIGVQSPGSPVRQSGVLVDSQHPDLALQL